ncbi:hypothetical protein F5883DRAFT_661661 [Diaporthe sp. PMI_573]|nr:hypothetical protein F5883DRAFT_661661 [Diaporthaceae sp. PMI_573]
MKLDSFLRGRSFNDFAVFLQSWLYFGMLALCLEQSDLSRFIHINSAGEKVLNTTILLPLIQQWYDRTFQRHMQSPDPLGSYDEEFYSRMMVLDVVERHADSFFKFDKTARARGTALFRIGVSTKLVWYPLKTAAEKLRRAIWRSLHIHPMDDPLMNYGVLFFPAGSELWKRLMHRGWCPNMINNLRKTVGVEPLILASMIQKNPEVSASHARCHARACVANQVQAGQYMPKHTGEYHDGGTCKGIGLPLGSADKVLLETDSFPVVRLWLGMDPTGSRPRLMEAVPFTNGLKYIAISHVWSDGLGDEKGNRILACQYDRLGMLLSEVLSMENTKGDDEKSNDGWSPFFWLDTICVPHQNAARRLACARMASSYECADTVLVLDAELQAWPYTSATDEEALLRIVTSGWTTRVWTLSEGIVAKRLVFKLADTMLDYASFGDKLRCRNMNGLYRFETLSAVLYDSLKQMRSINTLDGAERMYTAMSLTKPRRTSHPGDEIISLAVLMGMDGIEDIYDQPTWAGKMIRFLQMMPELPLCLLFSSGPRLSETGFRWAPAALNGVGRTAQMLSWSDTAELDRKNGGLLLSRQGMLLHGDWASIVLKKTHVGRATCIPRCSEAINAFYRQLPGDHDVDYDLNLVPSQEDWCFIESLDGWHAPFHPDMQRYCHEDEHYIENSVALATTALAVIVDAPNFVRDEMDLELLRFQGVLVSNVVFEDDGIISCQYQSMVTVSKYWRISEPTSSEDGFLHCSLGTGESVYDLTGVDPVKYGTYKLTKSSQVWRVM